MANKVKISIVGSGIIGLAHALAFARQGHEVSVFERHRHPVGASIRNFGLFWAIGQEAEFLPVVRRSREIWLELLKATNLTYSNHGALILAYSNEEFEVLKEFSDKESGDRPGIKMLSARDILKSNLLVNPEGLVGGIRSENEFSVNPGAAISKIVELLQNRYGVKFYFNTTIRFVSSGEIASEYDSWPADVIVICNGDDFETLFPEDIRSACLEKCHLQMMKARTNVFTKIGATMCSGLSLLHYPSFSNYKSFVELRKLVKKKYSEYLDYGIHVMLAQNESGDLIIGDSHKYDEMPQPFNHEYINLLILKYLDRFVKIPSFVIKERWTGTYSVHPEKKHFFSTVAENVWISTGFGGSGMTLGFGQAEKNAGIILNSYYQHAKFQNYPVAF
jgi:FAD dependent oxidoreductase TIGR03364